MKAKRISAMFFILAFMALTAVSCGETNNATPTLDVTISLPTNDLDTESVDMTDSNPSEESTPESVPEIDFDAMRKTIFENYPGISHFNDAVDYLEILYTLDYQRNENIQERMTLEEFLNNSCYAPMHKWSTIDPFSQNIVRYDQVSMLREGQSISEYEAILGGLPNYWNRARDEDRETIDPTYYYYLEDGSILKLVCRFARTADKDEAGVDGFIANAGTYWTMRLRSHSVITFEELIKEGEYYASLYPLDAVHCDPRTDISYWPEDYWPEIFVEKYGLE